MGEIIVNIGGGGGVSSDDVTASKWDVVQGKKTVTTDSGDEVVEGTLPDIPSLVAPLFSAMDAWGYYMDFEKGAYRLTSLNNGAGGRVYEDIKNVRKNIGYTDPSKVLTGTTIAGLPGTMPIVAPNVDGNKVWSTSTVCLEGLVDSGIYNSHYYNGVSYVRSGLPNLIAANIKKGVNIGGLVGTFEGWVPEPQDLFYGGQLFQGLRLHDKNTYLESNLIKFRIGSGISSGSSEFGLVRIYLDRVMDVHSYTKIMFDGYFSSYPSTKEMSIYIKHTGQNLITKTTVPNGARTFSLNIENVATIGGGSEWMIISDYASSNCYISKIRLA